MCSSCAPEQVHGTNGTNGTNGEAVHNGHTNGTSSAPPVSPPRARANPYQPVGDFLSNVGRFKIIESTLREGEQFANAFFDLETKIKMYVLLVLQLDYRLNLAVLVCLTTLASTTLSSLALLLVRHLGGTVRLSANWASR